ncbi:DUF1450 domain-containing protein [Culicoidibacter larvae]|uniref:DUF1450 domain-containing protein n=1 Tax=Culicoidibacter larvae TaxID=2579976 RepID=A0A5R8QCB0_9FIRM|nr:DUF1450 domain-containing protein [Culicoidibacter larvae]TLG73920.1 DUF1450 domain-containing protein [Culicoidibacter larvae]
MNIELKICGQCKGTNVKTLVPRLLELFPEATIEDKCHSVCGPGRTMAIVIIGDRQFMAPSEDALLAQLAAWKEDEDL